MLQWVRGPITAVMKEVVADPGRGAALQWVRGPITAVMNDDLGILGTVPVLQWVRGPITAVMATDRKGKSEAAAASMGPRSDNRGYGSNRRANSHIQIALQWVRGPITAVMREGRDYGVIPGTGFNGSAVR